jgi:hypothetical protein
MTRLLFTNLTMLAGLGALAVPVLIHLLLRQRRRRLRFSTLRFFDRQDEQSSQRRRLRNFLLLAMRMLLVALLVLAFARPYLAGSQAANRTQQRRLAVIMLDRTASLQASDSGVARWPRAREAVQKILADLGPDDRAALISCAARSEVLAGVAPPEGVGRLLKDLQPGCGTGSLGDGLPLAAKLVSSVGSDFLPTLHLVSDLQAQACRNLAGHPVPPNLEVRVAPAGDVIAPNLAVATLQLDSRGTEPPHATIASFGAEETKEVKMTLVIDEKEAFSRTVALSTGGVTRVELAPPALAPGWHSGAVRIEAGDSLALDNARYDAFFVPQPIRVLVAETRPGKRVFEQESFFLMNAFDPMRDVTNPGWSPFAVEKVSPDEVAKRLAAQTEPAACDLVVLPGLKEIPSGLGRALSGFVQGGGGLLLFLGEEVGASRYNSEFGNLLPAQLGRLERNSAAAAGLKWHLEDYDLFSPMFSVFRRPHSGNLALPEFTRRFTVTTNQGAVVAAWFGDGLPVIASRTVGRGRVTLVNASADAAWTDWPKHKTFVPWLHSLGQYLAGRAGIEPVRAALHLAAAEDADLALGATAKRQTFRVLRPGRNEVAAVADEKGELRNLDLSLPGVYSVRNSSGQEVQRVVVNAPGEESDLAALTPMEFQRRIERGEAAPPSPLAAGLFGDKTGRNDLERLLLLAALGLLFAEVFVANRSYA